MVLPLATCLMCNSIQKCNNKEDVGKTKADYGAASHRMIASSMTPGSGSDLKLIRARADHENILGTIHIWVLAIRVT